MQYHTSALHVKGFCVLVMCQASRGVRSTSTTAIYLPSGLNFKPLLACLGPEMYTNDFDVSDHIVILHIKHSNEA